MRQFVHLFRMENVSFFSHKNTVGKRDLILDGVFFMSEDPIFISNTAKVYFFCLKKHFQKLFFLFLL